MGIRGVLVKVERDNNTVKRDGLSATTKNKDAQ